VLVIGAATDVASALLTDLTWGDRVTVVATRAHALCRRANIHLPVNSG
jgi:hypothetical protein